MSIIACAIDGCERAKTTREWCRSHYSGLQRANKLPPKACKGCGNSCPGPRHYCSDDCIPRCAVEGCEDPRRNKEWCVFHFGRWKATGDASAPLSRRRYAPGQLCPFDGCKNEVRRNGLCTAHEKQAAQGKELVPIVHKSKSLICAFCGGPSGIQKGYRRVCSSKCSAMFKSHGGPMPKTYECILCKEQIPIMTKNGIRRKYTTKKCLKCRRNSMKHGYSAAQLARRDGNECHLCNTPVDMTLVHPDLMRGSVDHIIPTSLGGSNEPDNVQLAHLHCNIKKNNRVDIAA